MSQILPPRGFQRTDRLGPIADPTISAEEYRLWKLIDAFAWDGVPLSGNSLTELNMKLASLMGVKPDTLRKLRASLVSRGLVAVATSGGMTTLEACDPDVDNAEPHGDNSTPTESGVVENPAPEGDTVAKNCHEWQENDGKKMPTRLRGRGVKANSFSSSYSLFNKDGVAQNRHDWQKNATNGEITPQLAEMCQRLQSLGIYRRPALAIAQRAIAAELTSEQLVSIAQSRIDQNNGNLALAASLLRDEPLAPSRRGASNTKQRWREEMGME